MSAPTTEGATGPARPACQNCGAPLLGEHCYACGQPVKGLVRHFSSIIGDFLDSVLNIDARVFRTLWPLFAKPGYLSLQYFEGHRVRFVSPVRLFVFLSIVTFFVAQFTLDFGNAKVGFDNASTNDAFRDAKTVQEVETRRDEALAGLRDARQDAGGTPGVGVGLGIAEKAIREDSAERIAELRAEAGVPAAPATQAQAADASAGDDEDKGDSEMSFNGRPWHPVTNPIRVDWLPAFANAKLNEMAGKLQENVRRGERDPNLIKDAALSTVPSTLFVLLPVFALMLKFAYAFKRRLYMEHLIVALHSHAFLCLALLAILLLAAVEDAVAPQLGGLFTALETALWIWMPVYLLVMQKRVYGQGWIMTVLKYFALGICYAVLLSLGAAFTMLASLVWM